MGGIILLLAIFFATGSEVKAYHPDSTTVIISVGGCDWLVDISFECSITAGVPSEFAITRFLLANTPCATSLSDDEIARALGRIIADNPLLYITACNWSQTPCPTFSNTWRKYEFKCWSKRQDTNNNVIYEPCLDKGGCQTEYEYCFDGTNVISMQTNWSYEYGSGDCPFPVIPQPYYECFKVETMCN
jgi:hypothetical protein